MAIAHQGSSKIIIMAKEDHSKGIVLVILVWMAAIVMVYVFMIELLFLIRH